MNPMRKKELPFERVLFFSDAVVAIAITLLALDLKLELPAGRSLSFSDLWQPWQHYLAFLLSFINIAGFWRTHHRMYIHIRRMNETGLTLNVCWLFFIVTLPFATNILSSHFGQSPAVFLYSLNILLVSIFQNFLWDSADRRADYMDGESVSSEERSRFRLMFNLDMLNGLVSVVLAFFVPKLAFFLLFFKVPIFIGGAFYMARVKRHSR